MKLVLLTPIWIPDLYDLAAMLYADRIILQDNGPFSRKGRMHRARIRTPDRSLWIHVPIRNRDKSAPVSDILIDQSTDWDLNILRVLKMNYRNSIYFDFYEPEIAADLKTGRSMTYLLEFILYTHQRLFDYLELNLHEELAGMLNDYDSDPDRFARKTGATQLIQEHDSRHYQRQATQGSTYKFQPTEYHQHFGNFIDGCCLYDLLFEYGPESFNVVDQLN